MTEGHRVYVIGTDIFVFLIAKIGNAREISHSLGNMPFIRSLESRLLINGKVPRKWEIYLALPILAIKTQTTSHLILSFLSFHVGG